MADGGVHHDVLSTLHVDLDAFFASVEQHDNPEYVGRPVIVGGLGRRGVVATASYEARQFGVGSALPMARARLLCPDGIFVVPRIDRYRQASNQVRAVLGEFANIVEAVSIDEAYIDLTSLVEGEAPYDEETGYRVARRLLDAIKDAVGLPASIGIARTKFVAKLAGDAGKPHGIKVIDKAGEQGFLWPMSVERLHGVGPATAKRLHDGGIHQVGDIADTSTQRLGELVGERTGTWLAQLARGEDDRVVTPEHERKSYSTEATFDYDITSVEQLSQHLPAMAAQVAGRLRHDGQAGRTVTIKCRFSDFTTVTRSMSSSSGIDSPGRIAAVARTLLVEAMDAKPLAVRLLGIGVSHLEEPSQLELNLFPQDKLDEGMTVTHGVFGTGKVLARRGELIKVAFEDGRERILDLRLAQLEVDAGVVA